MENVVQNLLPLLIWTSLYVTWAQKLHHVRVDEIPPVRVGQTARLRCSYVGDNVTVQYISWTKLGLEGKRTYVYEYSEHPMISQAYNGFVGRASIGSPKVWNKGTKFVAKPNRGRKWPRREVVLNDVANSFYDSARSATFKYDSDLSNDMYDYENHNDSDTDWGIDTDPYNVYAARNRLDDVGTGTDYGRVRREAPVRQVDLYLNEVKLSDGAKYECLVKPLGGAARSAITKLVVQVGPSAPTIDSLPEPFNEGENITLVCHANVGKPPGTLSWSRARLSDVSYQEIPDQLVEMQLVTNGNGTCTAISKLRLAVSHEDDGASYRCLATSEIMGAYEIRPYAEEVLDVEYPPRGGRILFDTAVGRYYCHARGKPSPTYAWIWMRPDGRQTIMSSDRYLDLQGMRTSGYYRFHCLASNVIRGIRHTKVMATKLRVIAPKPTTAAPPVTEVAEIEQVASVRKFAKQAPNVRYEMALDRIPTQTKGSRTVYRPKQQYVEPRGNVNSYFGIQQRVKPRRPNPIAEQKYQPRERPPPPRKTVPPPPRKISPPPPPQRKIVPPPERKVVQETMRRNDRVRHPPPTPLPDRNNMHGPRAREIENRPIDPIPTAPVIVEEERRERPRISQNLYSPRVVVHHSESSTRTPYPGPKPEAKPYRNTQRPPSPAAGRRIQYITEEEDVTRLRKETSRPDLGKGRTDTEDEYEYVYYDEEEEEEDTGAVAQTKNAAKAKVKETQPEVEEDPAAYANEYEDVQRASATEHDCGRRGDGVYGAGCRAFYRCLRGITYFVECKRPYVYNKRTAKCDKPETAPAPCGIWRNCSDSQNGKFADRARKCAYYYTCWHGYFMGHNECNPGLVFHERVQLCDWPENVAPPCGTAAKQKKKRRKIKKKRVKARLTG